MRSGSSEKRDVGVARRADDAGLEVLHAAEGVDQLAERVAVERPRYGVDGEVAAALVILERAGFDLRLARIAGVGLLAGPHELDLDPPAADHRRAEGLEDRDAGVQLGGKRLGHLDAASDHHHVDVGRGAVQVVVADVAPHDEGPHAPLVGNAPDAAEYGLRQRLHVTSRTARWPSSRRGSPRPSGADRRSCSACRAVRARRPAPNRCPDRGCPARGRAPAAACWSR